MAAAAAVVVVFFHLTRLFYWCFQMKLFTFNISGRRHFLWDGPRDAGGAAPLATLPCQLQSCALPRYKTAERPQRIKPAANEKQTPPVLQLLCERQRDRERGGGGWLWWWGDRGVRWGGPQSEAGV